MAFQDVGPLEGRAAQDAAVRTLRIVRCAVSLEVLTTLVSFEANRASVESLGVGHGDHSPWFHLTSCLVFASFRLPLTAS